MLGIQSEVALDSTSGATTMTIAKQLRFVLIGPPASGKGTIARLLQTEFGPLQSISTGVLLQKLAQQPNEEGRWMRDFLASGNLMEDDQITDILFNVLNRHRDDSWLLDGYPRTTNQALILDSRLRNKNEELSMAILLDIPRQAIEERVLDRWVHVPSGRTYSASFNPPRIAEIDDDTGEALIRRHDDNTVTFAKRYNNYLMHAQSLAEYYQSTGKLFVAHGNDSPSLYAQIRSYLLQAMGKRKQNMELPLS